MTRGWVVRLISGSLLCLAVQAAEPSLTKASHNQFTDQDERKLGEALARTFELRYPILDNTLLNSYLAGVTKRLGDRARRPEPKYSVKILNISEVNSFSLPSGGIYLTRGALNLTQSESELAAALAHEIAHVAGWHALNRFSLELRSKSLWASVRGALPTLAANKLEEGFQALGAPVGQMLAYRYDKSNENEADLLAFYNLIRAGWNPAGHIRWLERIEASGSKPELTAFRSSHPDAGGRSRTISTELKSAVLSPSLDDDSLAFRTMKLGLDLLPKPAAGK